MNPTRPVVLLALVLGLPLVLSGCGNKGPLVRATPVPATVDGAPTIDAPVEGEAVPAEDAGVDTAIEDTDPSDEITLPDDQATEALPPEDEPDAEPAPDAAPPAEDPNG